MKRRIFISLAVLIAIWIAYRGYRMATTRSHSPAETINFSYKDLDINVTYSRPFKKGRLIFGEAKDKAWLPKGKFWTYGFRALTGLPRTTGALVPYRKYWRLGANDATEISFNKNINYSRAYDKSIKLVWLVNNKLKLHFIAKALSGHFGKPIQSTESFTLF